MADRRPGARARNRSLRTIAVLLLGLVAAMLPAAAPAAAAVRQYGYDISWPQCPGGNPMPPSTTEFLVIGLTFGLAFTENPCLADHVQWARDRAKPTHGYTMATYPTDAQLARYGASGPWSPGTLAGQLRNVGYAEAQYATASMRRVGFKPPMVWVDVEPRPRQPWPGGSDTAFARNRLVIEGLLRGLGDAGFGYGFYSYLAGWNEITGGWQRPDVPVWATAGRRGEAAAAAMCAGPSFSGGPVYLAQWYDDTFDWDLTCPAYSFPPVPPALDYLTVEPTWSLESAPRVTVAAWPSQLQYWSLTVSDLCTGAVVRTFSGRTARRISVLWDGRTAAGAAAPPGVYRLSLATGVTSSLEGPRRTSSHEIARYGSTPIGGCAATRTMAGDRYGTSVEIGKVAAPAARTVVLVSGADGHLVDGLVAAPYARRLGAPMLLSREDSVPDVVRDDLLRRGVTGVVVVGGPPAVSRDVVADLRAMGLSVSRVYGRDRYETAAAVARLVGNAGREIVVAGGADANLVDASTAGGPAAALRLPVVLTAPGALPGATAAVLADLGVASSMVTVVGGPSAVSAAVYADLAGRAGSTRRVSGPDRWSTATAVATAYEARVGRARVVLANGRRFVDALPGGTLARLSLLTDTAVLPSATGTWLRARPGTVVDILGSPAAVAPSIVSALPR